MKIINKFAIALMLVVSILTLFSTDAFAKDYSGAELYSREAVLYGRWEMRIMAAKGSGILSTFFLYKQGSETGTVPWEEVDIEIKGKDNAEIMQSNIITGTASNRIFSEELHSPYSFGDEFHTFVLEWTPDRVTWEINGEVVRETLASENSQVSDLTEPQSYRFNLWAAGIPEWVGNFDTSVLPVYQFVNWVSYSNYTPGQGDNGSDFSFEWRDDFEFFDSGRWSRANWTFAENLTQFSTQNVIVQDGMLILALTHEGEEGFQGEVPVDDNPETSTIESGSFIEDESLDIYPNPFNPTTNISFNIKSLTSPALLQISDVNGKIIETKEINASGKHAYKFDGSGFSSGVYFAKIKIGNKSLRQKMVLLK